MKRLIDREENGQTTTENYVTDSAKTFAYNVSLMAKLAAKAAKNEIVTWTGQGFTCTVRVIHADSEVESYMLNTELMTFTHTIETTSYVMVENLRLRK